MYAKVKKIIGRVKNCRFFTKQLRTGTRYSIKQTPSKPQSMQPKLVKIKNYERLEEALLDQSVLQQNNIECTINNSKTAEILPMLYEVDEGIALMVFDIDFDKSWEILKEYHQ